MGPLPLITFPSYTSTLVYKKKQNQCIDTHLNGSLGLTSPPLPPLHLPILFITRLSAVRAPTRRRRRRPNKLLPIRRLQILLIFLKAHTPSMFLRLLLL